MRSSGTRTGNGALLAVIVSFLVALALGQLPRSHPIISALHFGIPGLPAVAPPPSPGSVSLPSSLQLGSYLTVRGRLPPGESGTVTVEGAYDRAPWQLLASVPAPQGSYEARFPIDRPGILHLRVTYPDGRQAVGDTRVG